jgi:hypothetical protein
MHETKTAGALAAGEGMDFPPGRGFSALARRPAAP